MSSIVDLAEIPFLDDPAGQTARVLSRLVADTRARGAAVLVPDGVGLQVFSAVGMPVDQIATAQSWWRRRVESLRLGHAQTGGGHCLAPLIDRNHLLGVLLVYQFPLDPDALEGYQLILTAALRASRQPASARVADLLSSTSAADLQRHQLLATLDNSEWNISRVARVLGVTRRTVYMRMRKFGVLRRRVVKALQAAEPA